MNNPILGIIAGNSSFPLRFIQAAKKNGYSTLAVAHRGETLESIEDYADQVVWIKVGELGKLIKAFKDAGVSQAVMAGGISRVRIFGGVKLDLRGAALLAKLRSTKDDVIMRGIADELASEGVEVLPCTLFESADEILLGPLGKHQPTAKELEDIEVGRQALRVIGDQHIGQLVVVKDGVIVAVEAVEGTDATILRGGELGGPGTVVVKCAKPNQDMRFDVPTIGIKTIETLIRAKARVLAIETGRTVVLDEVDVVQLADKNRVAIVWCERLVE